MFRCTTAFKPGEGVKERKVARAFTRCYRRTFVAKPQDPNPDETEPNDCAQDECMRLARAPAPGLKSKRKLGAAAFVTAWSLPDQLSKRQLALAPAP